MTLSAVREGVYRVTWQKKGLCYVLNTGGNMKPQSTQRTTLCYPNGFDVMFWVLFLFMALRLYYS
jgi:hypothetical protein